MSITKQQKTKIQTGAACVAFVCFFTLFSSCKNKQESVCEVSNAVPHVVTEDIQHGIETHIEKLSKIGNGYFPLTVDDKKLSLKLVRVHTEYLATLGPQSYFACVDLVDTKGDVYDVDFFLAGESDAMVVTNTTPHKINGKPFYLWKQNKKGTWERVPVTEASQQLLGVVAPNDEFDFRYKTVLPEIKGSGRLWIPLPSSDTFQTIKMTNLNAPKEHQVLEDRDYGNKILFWELGPKDSGKTIDIRYHVKRIEKSAYIDNSSDLSKYLTPTTPNAGGAKFSDIANEVVKDKKTPLIKSRALYDHVIEHLRYAKAGDGWGKGDAVYACDAQHGNCTDFHAYFISLARVAGIPARFAIGVAIPANRMDGGVDGYHCWAEFYADGKWWPIDISEADKFSALSTYYFGHHPANRLEFSRGRNLVVEPGPVAGPINFLAYPVFEADGHPIKLKCNFSFHRDV